MQSHGGSGLEATGLSASMSCICVIEEIHTPMARSRPLCPFAFLFPFTRGQTHGTHFKNMVIIRKGRAG